MEGRRDRDPERTGVHRPGSGRGPDRLPDPLRLAPPRQYAAAPPADAIAVAPATFNTINKWAIGISDTLALGILCEAYGLGIPVAVQPYVNAAQAAHPAYGESLHRLRAMGVLVGDHVPHQPKADGGRDAYDWTQVLDLLRPGTARRAAVPDR